ncbi:MAG: alpha/beta hydrolase [Chloroflexota bacterium]|nr:alpha/beta hydrolase [Chloroflexota bacterium]
MNDLDPHHKVIRQAYGTEELQFGELRIPQGEGPHPTAMLIHGGFWRVPYGLTLMNGLAEDLATRGIATWNIEYRRVGDAGGGWPGTLLDVARAADHLGRLARIHSLDLGRVVTVGHSAGGHLACWLAARTRIAPGSPLAVADHASHNGYSNDEQRLLAVTGVMSLAGVVDLELAWRLHLGNDAVVALLGGGLNEVPTRYAAASPAALLPLGVPQVLVHGTADDRVPLQVSQAYTEAAIAAGDQAILVELAGVDHFALIDPHSQAWLACADMLAGLLAK